MTKPARDYPAGLTPHQFEKLGERLENGWWLPTMRDHAQDHGVDTTWSQDNEWAVLAARSVIEDFPPDPDGVFADFLVETGLRDEDADYPVGTTNAEEG